MDVDQRRAEIVRAAITLLDDAGLEALSLRRLAAYLRMHAPGLYWYVESKQDLVDRMAKVILDDAFAELAPLAPGQRWDDWMVELASTMRRALLAHRDGARVVAGAFLLRTEAITPAIERALEVLEGAGFPPVMALGGTMTLLRYAMGMALDEQASPVPFPKDAATVQQLVNIALPLIDAERFPRTADAYRSAITSKDRNRETMFRWGARMIVVGFEAFLKEPRRSL